MPDSNASAAPADFHQKPPLDASYRNASLPVEERVEDLLARMTLHEKLGQLSQYVFQKNETPEKWADAVRNGNYASFITQHRGPKLHNVLQKTAVEESRLGIPISFGNDVIHGYRVTFPITLGLACAWEPELLEKAQAVAAREAREAGVDWVFAPMCDLSRDPRWGRVAETCGEDPYINTLCTVAQVKGFQGDNPAAPDRVASCLKHYVGYGASVGGRDYNHTEIPESILRQSHLPPFRAGVEAGALTVMSSFNTLDGIPAAANRHTLTEILRNEWGFKGFVVSDWCAISEMIKWGFAKDSAEAARLGVTAGNDMDMFGDNYLKTLAEQVESGTVPLEAIDTAVRNVLRVKFQTGLFERSYTPESYDPEAPLAQVDLDLARECVSRSAVLLKNEGDILPLAKSARKIALIGPFGAERTEMHGCWAGAGMRPEDVVTLEEGFLAKLGDASKLSVVQGCAINTITRTRTLTDGSIVPDENATDSPDLYEIDEAKKAALEADVVIMALGEPRGWTGECASRAHIGLTGVQQQLFDEIAATGKPIVSVIFCGRQMAIPEIVQKSAAVLIAWQPGIQAGNGLADLIFGDVAPSGRLTSSLPSEVAQLPVYYNRYKTGRPGPSSTNYRDMTRNPLFFFGYGLTYTSFAYGPVEIVPAAEGKPAQARVTVTNTGKRDGHEVVQLYIRQLACSHAVRPEQELRGFQRIGLASGESATVSFDLTGEVLGYWRRDGQWHADEGDYHIWIAPQAHCGEPLTFAFKA